MQEKQHKTRVKFIVVGIITIILLYFIKSFIDESLKKDELYQEATDRLNDSDYYTAIKQFRKLPSTYKDVRILKKQAISGLIQDCESFLKEKDYDYEETCLQNIKELRLSNQYKAKTGRNIDVTLKKVKDLLYEMELKESEEEWDKLHNNPPFVGMDEDDINSTVWGTPDEVTEDSDPHGVIRSYKWFLCENGRQYFRSADAKGGSLFYVSPDDNGVDVSDISPNMRRCPSY